MKPRVAILGVTGFIGRGLPELFAARGVACTGVSRGAGRPSAEVDRWQSPEHLDFGGHHAVVNLAGESIAKRWTAANRRAFYQSRVGLTERVVEAMRRLPAGDRPQVLVNASAVGIYGDRGDQVLTEGSAPGRGFLAELCVAWEDAARAAEALGVKVVCLRAGVVLGRGGPAFERLARLFRLGLGGRLGSGRQWMPWIHLDDLRAAVVHAVVSKSLWGPVNCTAPAADRNRDFTRKLAAASGRPAILPVPAGLLKLVLGDFGAALLAGQHARPAALEADGFEFRFPTLESAFEDLLARPAERRGDRRALGRYA